MVRGSQRFGSFNDARGATIVRLKGKKLTRIWQNAAIADPQQLPKGVQSMIQLG